VIAGKIINVAEAIRLTNNFTIKIGDKTHVVFDSDKLKAFIEDSSCELVSFRYCMSGDGTDLIASPVHSLTGAGFPGLCSGNSNDISYSDAMSLTDNFNYNIEGVQAHIFRSDLVMRILELSPSTIRIFFGENKGRPVLVLTPEKIDQYDLVEEVCLNVGVICPPFCG
jgi:hypothetical protein